MDRDQGSEVWSQDGSARHGFALAELLTVLALTAFFAAVLLQTTLCLQRCLGRWEASARMRQTLSSAIFQMSRDIRMAGCNPEEAAVFEGATMKRGGGDAPDRLHVRMDRRGSKPGSPPDGDIEDPGEWVVYRWDDVQQVLRRNNQPMAAQIVQNPREVPVLDLIRDASRGLLRLSVTTQTAEGTLSLSSAVCIRNEI
jgi:type II secretory pathway component PulJ